MPAFRPSQTLVLAYIVALFAGFCAAKLLALFVLFRGEGSIFDLKYGFGPYIQNLVETGRFFSCYEGRCQVSSRMPLLPLIYAGIALFGTDQAHIGIIKSLIMSAYSGTLCFFLIRMQARLYPAAALLWAAALTVLFASYPTVKHAYELTYEEAILLEILLVWSVAFSVVSCLLFAPSEGRRTDIALAILLLNALLAFFTKASMVLILALSFGIFVAVAVRARFSWRAVGRSGAMALAGLGLLGLWAAHNAGGGRLTLMTSYDAESLYRGNSALGAEIYPDVNLDQIFDATEVVTRDGRHFAVPLQPKPWSFADEWAWSDHFRAAALGWIADNPTAAAGFLWRKAVNFFLSVEKSPYSFNADAQRATDNSRTEMILISAGLVAGRVATLALVVCGVLVLVTGSRADRVILGLMLLANMAYAAPYLVGFNYSRHIAVSFVIVLGSLVTLALRLWGARAARPVLPPSMGVSSPKRRVAAGP
ncbi:hypothetical protein [Aquabacter spiritensis]|uniref:Dolichyl-phosphate-mannose-protein mannosyltransferase n=1 Tax=Aquabacter spiritensis TaxID=933073 RepID=A0A4R3LV62_9HYPH|nr:hypothetical protein [Aquabacter spiritensis]TCT03549.1 hypothetical protein EDC64_10999 [Aquabacter spiritensis]